MSINDRIYVGGVEPPWLSVSQNGCYLRDASTQDLLAAGYVPALAAKHVGAEPIGWIEDFAAPSVMSKAQMVELIIAPEPHDRYTFAIYAAPQPCPKCAAATQRAESAIYSAEHRHMQLAEVVGHVKEADGHAPEPQEWDGLIEEVKRLVAAQQCMVEGCLFTARVCTSCAGMGVMPKTSAKPAPLGYLDDDPSERTGIWTTRIYSHSVAGHTTPVWGVPVACQRCAELDRQIDDAHKRICDAAGWAVGDLTIKQSSEMAVAKIKSLDAANARAEQAVELMHSTSRAANEAREAAERSLTAETARADVLKRRGEKLESELAEAREDRDAVEALRADLAKQIDDAWKACPVAGQVRELTTLDDVIRCTWDSRDDMRKERDDARKRLEALDRFVKAYDAWHSDDALGRSCEEFDAVEAALAALPPPAQEAKPNTCGDCALREPSCGSYARHNPLHLACSAFEPFPPKNVERCGSRCSATGRPTWVCDQPTGHAYAHTCGAWDWTDEQADKPHPGTAATCEGCPYEDKNECAPDINCDRDAVSGGNLLCDTCTSKDDPACTEARALDGLPHRCSEYKPAQERGTCEDVSVDPRPGHRCEKQPGHAGPHACGGLMWWSNQGPGSVNPRAVEAALSDACVACGTPTLRIVDGRRMCTLCRDKPSPAAEPATCETVPQEVHERGWQWRPVGDGAFAPPFGTIRACRVCGCLVAGGPNACVRCVKAEDANPPAAQGQGETCDHSDARAMDHGGEWVWCPRCGAIGHLPSTSDGAVKYTLPANPPAAREGSLPPALVDAARDVVSLSHLTTPPQVWLEKVAALAKALDNPATRSVRGRAFCPGRNPLTVTVAGDVPDLGLGVDCVVQWTESGKGGG